MFWDDLAWTGADWNVEFLNIISKENIQDIIH